MHDDSTLSPYTSEYIHPINTEILGPDDQLDGRFLPILCRLDSDCSALEDLFHESIIAALIEIVSTYSESTDIEKVLIWMYHQYPRVPTSLVRHILLPEGIAPAHITDPEDATVLEYDRSRRALENRITVLRENARVRRLKSIPYREYLQTEHWQNVRIVALEAAGHRCQLCNADSLLHVHLRTYERRGEEYPGDLIVLCAQCHQHFHEKLKVQR